MSAVTDYPPADAGAKQTLLRGVVIPAHPLALTQERKLDERHQRALTRYYLDAGAGGLAVGVHTTEFAIHEPRIGLYRPVLELAAEAAAAWRPGGGAAGPAGVLPTAPVGPAAPGGAIAPAGSAAPAESGKPVLIAGIIGDTAQAVSEARTARELGYDVGLLGLGALGGRSDEELVEHARRVAAAIPIMGFYLQPAVGGRVLSERFWRELVEIPNVVAIKMAPFNRYYTLDVVRAVAEAGRAGEIALYTGNDDSILVDLLTPFRIAVGSRTIPLEVRGGLLGHWAYWTRRAVEQLAMVREAREAGSVPGELLSLAAQVTESNEAVFDPQHSFRGCISGILHVLHRVGLVAGVYPVGEGECLSPGQAERIDRVMERYPHLHDETFVRANLSRWLG